jgi:hypothetical protein
MKLYTLNADGSLTIADDNNGKKNPDGSPAVTRWDIAPENVGEHMRDTSARAQLDVAITPAEKTRVDNIIRSHAKGQ